MYFKADVTEFCWKSYAEDEDQLTVYNLVWCCRTNQRHALHQAYKSQWDVKSHGMNNATSTLLVQEITKVYRARESV